MCFRQRNIWYMCCMKTLDRTRLTVLDELYLHLDREDEPWSVHLEIEVEGTIDEARLADAVREAALKHPLARARLADSRGTDVRYHWEIAEELEDVPLEVVDGHDLPRAREELLGSTPRLDRPGPFSLLLAHRPDGDALVMNLHHAAGDGLSTVRLMASIARAYAGVDDPLPSVEPLEVRDIQGMVGSRSIADRLKRSPAALEYLTRGTARPARIAPQGDSDKSGYGFELLKLDADGVKKVVARRREGATVNDVLLAALAITARDWNERHGGETGSAYLTMPINLRPPEWRYEVVGNYASYVSVHLSGDDLLDLESAIDAAAEKTRRIKDAGVAGLLIDLFEAPTVLPTAIKKRLQTLIPLTGNLAVDTAALSNLGRLESVPDLGDAGAVKAVWFSPPGRMPLGVSLGIATLEGELFVTLRYRFSQFDAGAAGEFAALFKRVLVDS
jgi:NRPS condensation-like uncharacterized protein